MVKLFREGHCTVDEAIALVSLHPARAAGLAEALGSIAPGKLADLIVIGAHGSVPVITRTYREGAEIFSGGYGRRATLSLSR